MPSTSRRNRSCGGGPGTPRGRSMGTGLVMERFTSHETVLRRLNGACQEHLIKLRSACQEERRLPPILVQQACSCQEQWKGLAEQPKWVVSRSIKSEDSVIVTSPKLLGVDDAFDQVSAEGGSRKWIRKILRFVRNLEASELHDADGVGGLAVVGQDEFGDPQVAAADDPPDSKAFLVGLNLALFLNVGSAAGAFAGLRVIQDGVVAIDAMLGFEIVGVGCGPVLVQRGAYLLVARCGRRRWRWLTVHFWP